MRSDELRALFNQQAAGYDQQWAKMSPIRDGLHFLLESVFAGLRTDARVLCVGAGTGAELTHLACRFPDWRFTVVEPSGAMLDVCRSRAKKDGFTARCDFHEGYLDAFRGNDLHDAAICLLVSQFILDQVDRSEFFRGIASRLHPGGILVSSDLASDVESEEYEALLRVWLTAMASADLAPEAVERIRLAYANDVAVVPPAAVVSIIEAGGFHTPVQFFQAGLIHAWFSRRGSGSFT